MVSMNNDYDVSNPPFDILTIDKDMLSIQEVHRFFEWYVQAKYDRLNYLISRLGVTSEVMFSDIGPSIIYYFLRDNIHVRIRSVEEIEFERATIPSEIRSIHVISDYVFIEPTLSIITDASFWFAEFILKLFPSLRWYPIDNIKMGQYGYPSLAFSKRKLTTCPLSIMNIYTHHLHTGRASEDRLGNIIRYNCESIDIVHRRDGD